jgi:hypothetical protein
MKIPAAKGVITIHCNQQLARDGERGVTPGQRNVHHVEGDTQLLPFKEPKRDNEKENIEQDYQSNKESSSRQAPSRQDGNHQRNLEETEENELLESLHKNKDVFAWSASDLRGVSREIIEHRFDINPSIRPKKQKLCKMSDEKVAAVKAEVQRLLDANVIREVKYPTWLANTVPVKKMAYVHRFH